MTTLQMPYDQYNQKLQTVKNQWTLMDANNF